MSDFNAPAQGAGEDRVREKDAGPSCQWPISLSVTAGRRALRRRHHEL